MTLIEVQEYGKWGWLVAISLSLFPTTKWAWDYFKNRNNNEKEVKLLNINSLLKQNTELSLKINELEIKIDGLELMLQKTEKQLSRSLDAFDIIFPIIEEFTNENQAYKNVIERAMTHINT